jgi:hypothetical protein
VQFENVRMAQNLLRGMLFHVAQAGEIIDDLAPGPCAGRGKFASFLQRAHLFQCQRVAFDGGGGVGSALAAVLGELGCPGDLHGSAGDLRLEVGHGLQLPEQPGGKQ